MGVAFIQTRVIECVLTIRYYYDGMGLVLRVDVAWKWQVFIGKENWLTNSIKTSANF